MSTDKKLWRNRKAKKELGRRLQSENPGLEVVHPHAAGIDVGNGAHYVAVRPDRDPQPVRRFECFTADLYRLADWLHNCGVKTVALQSTGVYWIPFYNILEERGFEVYLVNAHHTKNLQRITGVDLTRIDGVDVIVAQTVISEVGLDMSPWKTEAHFASWLGVCPDNRISGDKVLGRRTRHVLNRAANALRLGASTLLKSQTYLGAQYRRLRSKLGAPKAITAVAHRSARLVYRMLKYGHHYVDKGAEYYERRNREQQIEFLRKKAARLGLQLAPIHP